MNLNENEKEKCLGNSEDCKTCSEPNCNQRAEFLECYSTEAKQNQNQVHTNPEINASSKTCFHYIDTCFVQVLANDTVIRECVKDYADQNDLSSNFLSENEVNNRTYHECSTPLCNDDVIEPTFCLSCIYSGDKNCSDPLQMEDHSHFREQCPLELTPSGCFHYRKGEVFVRRGCASQLEDKLRDQCESNDNECKICHGDECNNRKEFLRCFEDRPTVNGTQFGVTEQICRQYNDECFIHVTNDAVQRGCLSHFVGPIDAALNITTDCSIPESDICEKCAVPLCNGREIEDEHCIVCWSNEDDYSCIDNPNDSMRQKCPRAVKKLGCYLKLEENDVVASRNCMFQLDASDRNECNSTTNGSCKSCVGDTCNKQLSFRKCFECSSESDGDECMREPNKLNSRLCPSDADQCYIHVDQNGLVRRNCTGDELIASSDDCTLDEEHCLACSGWKCNKKVIKPEICLHCDSNVDSVCRSATFNQTDECRVSVQDHGCFHFIENKSNGQHRRGKILELIF